MCGIFGAISNNLNYDDMVKATDLLHHRGPDDSGYHQDNDLFLGHKRLSIIDLDSGPQPIFNEDKSILIIFNGEIYNFNELKKELIKKGHTFETKTDTETIIHAYEEYGEDCVKHLRGMFAFAIWDKKLKKLFIARDRLGIKPLFYYQLNNSFIFSSEIKSILNLPGISKSIDYNGLASYFKLSYIPAPLTIYKNIKKLLPGHTLTYQTGKIKINKYWDLKISSFKSNSEKYYIDNFMEILNESIKLRMISDVPIGAFLSGGIDSGLVVALMSLSSEAPINTFTMGFGGNIGGYLDEREYAKQISKKYKTIHKEYEVIPEHSGILDKIVQSFDEPFADDSVIPSYYVSQIARKNVTVALSGLGGDELFAGYERYLGFELGRYYKQLPAFIRKNIINKLINNLHERADGHYTINHLKRFIRFSDDRGDLRYLGFISKMDNYFQRNLFNNSSNFQADFEQVDNIVLSYFNSPNVENDHDNLNRALYTDIKMYLPDDILTVTDRMSMHHSLEVRVPFIDHKLVEFVANIPSSLKIKWFRKKYLLKKASRKILPSSILNHTKQGFVGPTSTWLKNEMKPLVLNILSQKNLNKHEFLDHNSVKKILNEHFAGKEIHDSLIWSLIIFQKWYDSYID